MKRLCIFMLMAFAFTYCTVGCTETDADRVAKKIDGIYQTVRDVITDEAVLPEIPRETLLELKALETKYLVARAEYRKVNASNDSWSILKEMLSYGSGLVSLIKDLPAVSKYSTELTAAQATIKALVVFFN